MAEDLFEVPGVDELYAIDPGDFVARRNEISKRLKREGRPATAAKIAQLRKPLRLASAVNAVARSESQLVERLLEAGKSVKDAQAAVLQGGDRKAMREAIDTRRSIIARLASATADIAGDNYLDDAAATFEAASVDDDIAALVRAGRLTTEARPPTGLEVGGWGEALSGDETTLKARPSSSEVRKHQRAVDDAQRALDNASRRVDQCEAAVNEANAALLDAQNDRTRAQESLAAAQDALAELDSD